MRFLIVVRGRMAFGGCDKAPPRNQVVNITLRNSSSNALDWVKLDWKGPYVPGGILSPGISKTAVSVEWPNLSSAKITFVDDTTRKLYSVEVSLSAVNQDVRSGPCRQVTIRILDYEKADAICE